MSYNGPNPLVVVAGGTGHATVTTAPAASSWAGWDVHSNLSANNYISGYSTIATAAGTTTLTVASAYQQYFTGSTTQLVLMPVTSTLVLGQYYMIMNNSTGNLTIESSGANLILTMAPNTMAILTCILTSGTTAASWNATYSSQSGGGVSPGTINDLAYYAATGDVVSGLATANNGLLVTSGTGVPSIGNAIGADITINGITAGRGASNSATNTVFGNGAGASFTTGLHSVAIGFQALQNATLGTGSTVNLNIVAIGYKALSSPSVPGTGTVAIGYQAMSNSTISTDSSVAIGYLANLNAATSSGTTCVGSNSMSIGTPQGNNNSCFGLLTGANLSSGASNCFFGAVAGADITSGSSNILIGHNCCDTATTSSNNVIIGDSAATTLGTGSNNTILGNSASVNNPATTGAIAIGSSAQALLATGSTSGTNGPSLSIGSSSFPVGFRGDGTIFSGGTGRGYLRPILNGTAYLMPCFIDGTITTSASMITDLNGSPILTSSMTNGQLVIGSTGATPATGNITSTGSTIVVTNGAGTINLEVASSDTNLTITPLTSASSPYTVLSSDQFLSCDSTGGVITINLPNAPATGKVYYIKDATGESAVNNITLTTAGGSVTIDGATSIVMNIPYQSISTVFNGTSYEIF